MLHTSKRLRVLAGPNGSGKSTIISAIQELYKCGAFINADLIERKLESDLSINLFEEYSLICEPDAFNIFISTSGKSWRNKALDDGINITLQFNDNNLVVPDEPSSYDAAIAADFIRHQCLKRGETFTFETVLSHPSKIDFLKSAQNSGFSNYLYFICTVDPEINIGRVAKRVKEGGHAVPEDKIVERYYSSLANLPELIKVTHRTFLFDNSSLNNEEYIKPIAEIEDAEKLTLYRDDIPWWVEQHVLEALFPK